MDEQKEQDGPQVPLGEVRVVLVHGTWARGSSRRRLILPPRMRTWLRRLRDKLPPGIQSKPRQREAPWFHVNSFFARNLREMLEAFGAQPAFERPLRWSGRNSLLDRAEAARRLAQQLERQPDVPCVLVAHSYAGNIAMKAVSQLDPRHQRRIRLITLATPFVYLSGVQEERTPIKPGPEGKKRARFNYERLMLSNFCLFSTVQFATAQTFFPSLHWPVNVGGTLLMIGLALRVSFAEQREGERIHNKDDTCLARQLLNGAAYPAIGAGGPHLLVLRGVEDEASLAIAAAGTLGRVMQIARDFLFAQLYARIRYGWHLKGSALLLIVGCVIHFVQFGPHIPDGGHLWTTVSSLWCWISVLLLQPLWTLTGLAVLARIVGGIAAGRELFWMPNLEVSVSTAPDVVVSGAEVSGRLLRIFTVARPGRQSRHIRHQLYDDVEPIKPIVQFLSDSICLEHMTAQDAAIATVVGPAAVEARQATTP